MDLGLRDSGFRVATGLEGILGFSNYKSPPVIIITPHLLPSIAPSYTGGKIVIRGL